MKLFSVAVITATIYIAHCVASKNDDDNGRASLDEQWRKYKIEFSKNYGNDEDRLRFMLFRETLDQIKEHNAKYGKGLVDVPAYLNEYTDWTYEEKKKLVA